MKEKINNSDFILEIKIAYNSISCEVILKLIESFLSRFQQRIKYE